VATRVKRDSLQLAGWAREAAPAMSYGAGSVMTRAVGRSFADAMPVVDARLADGNRVHAVDPQSIWPRCRLPGERWCLALVWSRRCRGPARRDHRGDPWRFTAGVVSLCASVVGADEVS